MSNSLDPDQERRFIGPGLHPNSLLKLSADRTKRYSVNLFFYNFGVGVLHGYGSVMIISMETIVVIYKNDYSNEKHGGPHHCYM